MEVFCEQTGKPEKVVKVLDDVETTWPGVRPPAESLPVFASLHTLIDENSIMARVLSRKMRGALIPAEEARFAPIIFDGPPDEEPS